MGPGRPIRVCVLPEREYDCSSSALGAGCSNDGEKRHHLKGGIWHETDPALLQGLRGFEDQAARNLSKVAAWGLLPASTTYVG